MNRILSILPLLAVAALLGFGAGPAAAADDIVENAIPAASNDSTDPTTDSAAEAADEADEVADPEAAGMIPGEIPRPAKTAGQNPPVGIVIDGENLHLYEEFLSPAMQWVVDRGVKMRVGPYEHVYWPKPLRDATEKWSGQVELAPDGTHMLNYVAGIPFPIVEVADPFRAHKYMFNYDGAQVTDDLDLRNFDCETGIIGQDGSPVRVERNFLFDHFRRLYFTSRLEVDPFPKLDSNKDKARFKEALYTMIEPFDLKGVGQTFTRYLDHERQDDSWVYVPQIRRVRRLSSAQRSDALFGQDIDMDSGGGYAGNVAWMDWKFLGEKVVMGSFHAEYMPVVWGEPSGDFVQDDLWEPRDSWVIEGGSKLPQYAYSRRVIYVDKETYFITGADMYDQSGELWKTWVNNFKISRRPVADADYIAPHARRYWPSLSMVDVQLEHTSYCAMPSHRFPGETGWFINFGEEAGTSEDFFELSTMISAGR